MKSSKAFTLILSVITTLIVSALVESSLVSLNSHINLIAGQRDNIRAYNMAEAGLARGIIQLRAGTTTDLPGSLGAGTYGVHFTLLPGYPISFRITSTGGWGNASRTLNLEVFQTNFSQWLFFSNTESGAFGSPTWFVDGQIIDGPVFTNGRLNISGSPQFLGHVSSVATVIDGSGTGVFSGGLTLGAPSIPVQVPSIFLSPISAAAAIPGGGLLLNGDTTIEFTDDGDMWVTNAGVSGGVRTLSSLPANGAIYVDGGDLKISGTLNGKVTVGAGEVGTDGGDITIVGDLKYAGPRDANGLPTSPDNMLGLVANKSVYVGEMAQSDLEINAYMVALDGSFVFPKYESIEKGTLTLWGGIMQIVKGPVGLVGSTPKKGYTRDYHYDTRMRNESPLYFAGLTDSTGRILYAKRLWQGR